MAKTAAAKKTTSKSSGKTNTNPPATKTARRTLATPVIPVIPAVDPRVTAADKPIDDPIHRALIAPRGKPEPVDKRDMVTAIVPKAFRLTDDAFREHLYDVGIQEMPRAHAEHKYSIANGVTIPKVRKHADSEE